MRVLPIALGLAVALAGMSGCAPSPAPKSAAAAAPGAALGGGEWKVFEIEGQPVVANSAPTITFEDGRVFGAGSCNRFMGGYTLAPDGLSLQMSQMASTMMACPDALMAQEGRYLGVLGAVTGYGVEGGVLTLKTADGKTVKARR
jgi:heat shock protein HslJ